MATDGHLQNQTTQVLKIKGKAQITIKQEQHGFGES